MAVIVTPIDESGKISQQSILVTKSSSLLWKLFEKIGWSMVLLIYLYLGYFGARIFWAVL